MSECEHDGRASAPMRDEERPEDRAIPAGTRAPGGPGAPRPMPAIARPRVESAARAVRWGSRSPVEPDRPEAFRTGRIRRSGSMSATRVPSPTRERRKPSAASCSKTATTVLRATPSSAAAARVEGSRIPRLESSIEDRRTQTFVDLVVERSLRPPVGTDAERGGGEGLSCRRTMVWQCPRKPRDIFAGCVVTAMQTARAPHGGGSPDDVGPCRRCRQWFHQIFDIGPFFNTILLRFCVRSEFLPARRVEASCAKNRNRGTRVRSPERLSTRRRPGSIRRDG